MKRWKDAKFLITPHSLHFGREKKAMLRLYLLCCDVVLYSQEKGEEKNFCFHGDLFSATFFHA